MVSFVTLLMAVYKIIEVIEVMFKLVINPGAESFGYTTGTRRPNGGSVGAKGAERGECYESFRMS